MLDELAPLAAQAQGPLPAAREGSLAAALARRVRERLFQIVERALEPLDPGRLPPPLEAWERWLALSALLDRIEEQAGRVTVTTLWHGGVRDAIWNATCALHNRHGARAAWVSHAMFTAVADRADYLGDLPAALVNRENARVALRAAS